MNKTIKKDQWVFVIIQNPGANEQIVGMHDDAADVDFIPVFKEKEIAAECFINMPRETGKRYEVQAIIFEDLETYAFNNNFIIFFLDKQGKILNQVKS